MTLLRMLAFAPVSLAAASGAPIAPAPVAPAMRPAPVSSPAQATATGTKAKRIDTPAEPTVTSASPEKKAVSPAMAALAAVRSGKTSAKAAPPHNHFLSEPEPELAPDAEIPIHLSADLDIAQKKTEQPVETILTPVAASGIDWPALVTQLPLKGVAQQLATQSELLGSEEDGQSLVINLRVPVETLLSAGSVDKLASALGQHFQKTVRLVTDIGAVTRTAHADSVTEQARRQQLAEKTMNEDPFVQTLIREFGATFVPGSIKPV